ncbi:antifreeze protein Maxi-like [Bacillus rossius redtenbacheri]|uniref:antifreeze protein Maxi-like n=1 Tax=Bacillus rossius redtenbacheri TaxID=93214 RepID=UPI002FDE3839
MAAAAAAAVSVLWMAAAAAASRAAVMRCWACTASLAAASFWRAAMAAAAASLAAAAALATSAALAAAAAGKASVWGGGRAAASQGAGAAQGPAMPLLAGRLPSGPVEAGRHRPRQAIASTRLVCNSDQHAHAADARLREAVPDIGAGSWRLDAPQGAAATRRVLSADIQQSARVAAQSEVSDGLYSPLGPASSGEGELEEAVSDGAGGLAAASAPVAPVLIQRSS